MQNNFKYIGLDRADIINSTKAFQFYFAGNCITIPVPFQIIRVKLLLYKHGMTFNQINQVIQSMLS